MIYTTTINDESVPGITAAREAYNTSLPQTVKSTVDGVETDVPNPDLLPHDSAYLDYVLSNAVASWNRQYAPVIVPVVPPAVVNGVPQEVTMRQAQLALLGAGLLSTVETAIDAIPGDAGTAAKITWTKSSVVERDNALIGQLAVSLGLTPEQIDALFITAATL